MKNKRGKPFCWPSWVSKLVSGEDMCEWKYWFKSHYTYDKLPSDFNLARWNISHTQLLRSRVNALERLGFKVYIEDQNSFKINVILAKSGQTILDGELPENEIALKFTISGKADIVAIGEDEDKIISGKMHPAAVVEDCKTGSCKTSDHVQVIIYMLFLPKAIEKYKDLKFSGCIVYKNGVPNVDIPIEAATEDEELKQIIWDTIKKIVSDESNCRRTPSKKECDWCDIPKSECSARIG